MVTIKTKKKKKMKKDARRRGKRERVARYKNSHNLGIVTGNGLNNFQPVARKRSRKRLVMPRPWPFLVSPSADLRKKGRLRFSWLQGRALSSSTSYLALQEAEVCCAAVMRTICVWITLSLPQRMLEDRIVSLKSRVL